MRGVDIQQKENGMNMKFWTPTAWFIIFMHGMLVAQELSEKQPQYGWHKDIENRREHTALIQTGALFHIRGHRCNRCELGQSDNHTNLKIF